MGLGYTKVHANTLFKFSLKKKTVHMRWVDSIIKIALALIEGSLV